MGQSDRPGPRFRGRPRVGRPILSRLSETRLSPRARRPGYDRTSAAPVPRPAIRLGRLPRLAALVRRGPGSAARPAPPLLSVVLLIPNTRSGKLEGAVRRAKTSAFAADLAAGLPLDELADRNAGRVYPVREVLLMRFGQLRDAGIEPYRRLPLTATACPAAPPPAT